MKIKLNKDKFNNIDSAFLILKKDNTDKNAVDVIKQSLEYCFDNEFEINIVNNDNPELFVMSVYPEVSVIDKIISAVITDNNVSAIQTLWKTNKKWTIEIDGKILNDNIIDCSEKELTAMLLHEVGHIVCSSSIPNRISLILKYELIKTNSKNKMMIKDKVFRSILSLPILDSCVSDSKRTSSSIKEEIKADSFVKKMGYKNELISVLNKLSKNNRYPNKNTINDKISKVGKFSLKTLEEFQQRKDKLAKKSLLSLKEDCQSPYINNVIDTFIECVFNDNIDSLYFYDGRKIKYMQERADKDIEDGYFTEFFIFGKKELKRVDPTEIDYIAVKIQDIKNVNDKMMIVSYIHSKLDLVEYYICILENPKLAKKYNIPQSLNQLYEFKKRLLLLRDKALEFKIPEKNRNILVSWPSGYEG